MDGAGSQEPLDCSIPSPLKNGGILGKVVVSLASHEHGMAQLRRTFCRQGVPFPCAQNPSDSPIDRQQVEGIKAWASKTQNSGFCSEGGFWLALAMLCQRDPGGNKCSEY